ncbi:hypothetical protein AB1Y20_012831 [Prymnesium parvum]|uniref:Uncharacterized protein n=1 Tax=Prymnesium parvum TaxID=97485 RepID=A0AB34ILU8_PRYPA
MSLALLLTPLPARPRPLAPTPTSAAHTALPFTWDNPSPSAAAVAAHRSGLPLSSFAPAPPATLTPHPRLHLDPERALHPSPLDPASPASLFPHSPSPPPAPFPPAAPFPFATPFPLAPLHDEDALTHPQPVLRAALRLGGAWARRVARGVAARLRQLRAMARRSLAFYLQNPATFIVASVLLQFLALARL